MFVHAVAFSLPDQTTYQASHAHVDPGRCVWTKKDREFYYTLLKYIEEVYKNPEVRKTLKASELAAYKPEGLSLDDALQRVVPYHVTADRATKNTVYLEERRDTVSKVKEVGLDSEFGINFYVLVKQHTGLEPTPQLLQRVFRSVSRKGHTLEVREQGSDPVPGIENWKPGMEILVDGNTVDLNSKEFRRYPMLVSVARARPKDELITQGELKIVAVPNDIEVDIVSNRGGEVVRERARTWG